VRNIINRRSLGGIAMLALAASTQGAGALAQQGDPAPPPTSMRDLRIAGWELLEPFTARSSGLPSRSDPERWIAGLTLLPDHAVAQGAATLLLEADLVRHDDEPTLWEATFFNGIAEDFVNTEPKLNVWETSYLLAYDRLTRGIEFPRGAKAVKTFWYRLGDKPTRVRVWDWHEITAGVTQAPLEKLRTVCVEREVKTPGCLRAEDAFYTATLAAEDVANVKCDANCTEHAQPGDFMILVGMHIAAKTTPEWLWATYWWRDSEAAEHKPWPDGESWTCVAAQREIAIKSLKTPWSNYSMDVTASFKHAKPFVNPAENCGEPGRLGRDEQKVAMYNPFVEARFANGLKSSCVHCHAAVNTNTHLRVPDVLPPYYSLQGLSLSDFEGHVRLDYIWSLRRSLKPTWYDD
jgi:hypothetical protein